MADLVILLADGAQSDWHEEAETIAKDVTAPMIKFVNKADICQKMTILAVDYANIPA